MTVSICPTTGGMTLKEAMERYPGIFCIYRNPSDFPGKIVMRLWFGTVPEGEAAVFDTVEEARQAAIQCGADTCLGRFVNDDPCIVESWI